MPTTAVAKARTRRRGARRTRNQTEKTVKDTGGPINKLPRETLEAIFLALRDLYFPDSQLSYRPPATRSSYAWAPAILQVNRQWHEVALGCARLWNYVEASHPESLLLLHRSKESPLNLGFSPDTFRVVYLFPESFPDVSHRLKSFATFGASKWQHAFDGVTTLPLLQDLLLDYAPLQFLTSRHLPPVFMSGTTPNIRRVRITGYHIDWAWSIFSSSLRVLILSEWDTSIPHDAVELSFEETVAALGRLPLLEYLGLHGVVKSIDEEAGGTVTRVTLEHLRSLSVSGPASVCRQILSTIEHPSNTTLDITATVVPAHFDTLVDMMELSAVLRDKFFGEGIIGRTRLPSFKGLIFSHRPAFQRLDFGQTLLLQCLTDDMPSREPDDDEAKNIPLYYWREGRGLGASHMAWELDCAPGVRIKIKTGEPEEGVLDCDDWLLKFCGDWPLDGVTTLLLGNIGITLQAAQRICPAVTTLMLMTQPSDDIPGPLSYLETLLCYNPIVTASAETESGFEHCIAHPRLPRMDTLVLDLYVKKKSLDALQAGLQVLQRSHGITFERLAFVIDLVDFERNTKILRKIGREFGLKVSVYHSINIFNLVHDAADKY
ncbi:hypothetical protein BC629DRAFT_1597539 [Irpex lacteus]|nr:hypothetical protein BC629DRAFT_1597539 [Irpex lacteus]